MISWLNVKKKKETIVDNGYIDLMDVDGVKFDPDLVELDNILKRGDLTNVQEVKDRDYVEIVREQLTSRVGLDIFYRDSSSKLERKIECREKSFDFHPYVAGFFGMTASEIYDRLVDIAFEKKKISKKKITRYFNELSVKFMSMYQGDFELLYLGDLLTETLTHKMVAKWLNQKWYYCPLANKGKFVMSGIVDSRLDKLIKDIDKLPDEIKFRKIEMIIRIINNIVDATVMLSHYQKGLNLNSIWKSLLTTHIRVLDNQIFEYVKLQLYTIFEFYKDIDFKISTVDNVRVKYFKKFGNVMRKSLGVESCYDLNEEQQRRLNMLAPFANNTVFVDANYVIELLVHRYELAGGTDRLRFMIWNPQDIDDPDTCIDGGGGYLTTKDTDIMVESVHTLLGIDKGSTLGFGGTFDDIVDRLDNDYYVAKAKCNVLLRPGLDAFVHVFEIIPPRKLDEDMTFGLWLADKFKSNPKGFDKFKDIPVITVFDGFCSVSVGKPFDLNQMIQIFGLRHDRGRYQLFSESFTGYGSLHYGSAGKDLFDQSSNSCSLTSWYD